MIMHDDYNGCLFDVSSADTTADLCRAFGRAGGFRLGPFPSEFRRMVIRDSGVVRTIDLYDLGWPDDDRPIGLSLALGADWTTILSYRMGTQSRLRPEPSPGTFSNVWTFLRSDCLGHLGSAAFELPTRQPKSGSQLMVF
jgi:hypothetical protein